MGKSTYGTGALAAVLTVAIPGCAYNVQPGVIGGANIYSVHADKVPGHFVLVIDPGVRNTSRDIRPSSHVCGAHTYPVTVGNAIGGSIHRALEMVFESIREHNEPPTIEAMREQNIKGAILVRLDNFEPKLRCSTGMWSGQCTATTDLSLGVIIRGPSENLFASSASGTKSAEADTGSACDGGARALADSITGATRDALERLGERMSHAPRLRPTTLK